MSRGTRLEGPIDRNRNIAELIKNRCSHSFLPSVVLTLPALTIPPYLDHRFGNLPDTASYVVYPIDSSPPIEFLHIIQSINKHEERYMAGRIIKTTGLIPVFLFLVLSVQASALGQERYGRDTTKSGVKTKKTETQKPKDAKESDTRKQDVKKDSRTTDQKSKSKSGVSGKDASLPSKAGSFDNASVIRRSSDTTYRRGGVNDTLIIQDTLILRGGDRSRGGFPDSTMMEPGWNSRRGGINDTSVQRHDRQRMNVNDSLLNDQERNKRRGGMPDTLSSPPDSNKRRGGIIDTMMGPPEIEPDDNMHRPDSLR